MNWQRNKGVAFTFILVLHDLKRNPGGASVRALTARVMMSVASHARQLESRHVLLVVVSIRPLVQALPAHLATPPTSLWAPLAQDIPALNGSRGRITIYCVAETLNRDLLTKKLRERGPQFLLHSYPDVLYGRYHKCAAHRAALLLSACC